MQVENKKHAEWRKAVDQRKREATDVEERCKAVQTEAEVNAIQEHAMLFYGHNALVCSWS
jgi:hypothetical protein